MTPRRALVVCAILLAARWTATAQQRVQQEIPTGPNTLIGRVIDAGTGAPVGGAQITLMGYSGPSQIPSLAFYGRGFPASAGTSAPRGVITSGDGEFLFGQLPAGRYAIFVTAFGYLMGGYLSSTTTSPVHLVEIADNARPAPIVVRLVKGASISGAVTDDRGDPIVDAPVAVFARAGAALSPVSIDARTDDRGMYRIAQLPPDRYVVGVTTSARTIPAALGGAIAATSSDPYASSDISRRLIPTLEMDLLTYAPGHVPGGDGARIGQWILQRKGPIPPPAPDGRLMAYTTTLYPGTALPSEATTISLGSGEERTGVDMTMRLTPAVTISGVVTGPDGPIEDASVRLNPAGDGRDVSPTGEFTTITTAGGAFAFLGVPQGPYALTSSYLPTEYNETSPGMTVWAKQVVTAGDRDVSGLTLAMRPGVKVSGRVDYRNGTKPARVQVLLEPLGGIWQRSLFFTVAPDGRFVSGGNPPGRYRVNAVAVGSSTISISVGGRRLMDDTIVLDANDLAGVEVVMSATPLHVTGSIVDANGAPAAHANVIAFPADTMTWRQDGVDSLRRCVVAATSTGAFDCAGLAVGEYYVAAIDAQIPYRYNDLGLFERLIPGAARVTITDNGASQVALKLFAPKAP